MYETCTVFFAAWHGSRQRKEWQGLSHTWSESLLFALVHLTIPFASQAKPALPFPAGGGGRSATPNYLVIDLRARASQYYPFTYVSEHYMPDNLDGIWEDGVGGQTPPLLISHCSSSSEIRRIWNIHWLSCLPTHFTGNFSFASHEFKVLTWLFTFPLSRSASLYTSLYAKFGSVHQHLSPLSWALFTTE